MSDKVYEPRPSTKRQFHQSNTDDRVTISISQRLRCGVSQSIPWVATESAARSAADLGAGRSTRDGTIRLPIGDLELTKDLSFSFGRAVRQNEPHGSTPFRILVCDFSLFSR